MKYIIENYYEDKHNTVVEVMDQVIEVSKYNEDVIRERLENISLRVNEEKTASTWTIELQLKGVDEIQEFTFSPTLLKHADEIVEEFDTMFERYLNTVD